jgi:type IV pilus assembly protein PilO
MNPFSSVADSWNQTSLANRIWMAASGLVLLGLVLGYLLLYPRWRESKVLQKDIALEKIKLAQVIRTRAQIAVFEKELAEIDVRYKQIQSMLPEADEVPRLLKAVSNLGSQQGLEFLLFKPEKEIPKEFIVEIPITVHLKGSYHQIILFFDHLRRLSRIVNVQQLELGSYDEKTGQLNARCRLVTFRMPSSPPPSAGPLKGEKKK